MDELTIQKHRWDRYLAKSEQFLISLQRAYQNTTPYSPSEGGMEEGGVPNRHAPWLFLRNVCYNPKTMVYTVYGKKPILFPNRSKFLFA